MRRRGVLGILLVAGTMLAACGTAGGATTPTSRQTSMLTIAIGSDVDTLDTMHQTTALVENILGMVVETLTTVDDKGKIQPALATGWQESADGMSWVFTLRTGVAFSDGTPFEASVVKSNFDRLMDPKNVCQQCGMLT